MARGSTERLLVRSGSGDTAAFAELYDELAPRVFGMVSRLVHDPSAAERVAHDGFIETWRRSASYDPSTSSATTWVMGLVRRTALLAAGLTAAQADAVQRALGAEVGMEESTTALLTGALRTLRPVGGA